MADVLTRRIEFTPETKDAIRSSIGSLVKSENTSLRITFLVQGPRGATQFVVQCGPGGVIPSDKGYHSVERLRDWQEPDDRQPCEYVPGGYCYYDGSSLNANDLFLTWCEQGDEAMWAELENYYRRLFEGKEGE